jgi:hypothetical protein
MLGMGQLQFSLRWMFVVMTIIAVVLGGIVTFERLRREANKEARRQAVRAGRIAPEDARWILGNEVAVLKTELERSGK